MKLSVTELQPLPNGRAPGRPLFAIGDAHGYAGALSALMTQLAHEIKTRYTHQTVDVVLLGDLVDRGPDPVGCLRLAAQGVQAPNAETRLLLGNHDWYLAAAASLRGLTMTADALEKWMRWGGRETVAALGLEPFRGDGALVRERLGPEACRALEEMDLHFATGEVLCVHAGVDPDTALEEQTEHDLMWIRDRFLEPAEQAGRDWPLGMTVVHGHTPDAWGVFPHRIGVDSGGFYTGMFSAIEMNDQGVRFHCLDVG